MLLAIIQLQDASINGVPVSSESWTITGESALSLPTAESLPGLTDPPAEAWAVAWREWCQPIRGVAIEDVTAALLERDAHRLRVRMAERLLEKIKVARPEAFRGDGWLLAGDGSVRTAAELEFQL